MSEVRMLALAERSTMEMPMQQPDLFSGAPNNSAIVFVNLDKLDQDSLLNIIARNSIKAIVDLRRSPVFRRPSYEHGSLVSYFHKHGIKYTELAITAIEKGSESDALTSLAAFCSLESKNGVTLIAYDNASEHEDRPALMRKFLSQQNTLAVEMSYRALRGYCSRP